MGITLGLKETLLEILPKLTAWVNYFAFVVLAAPFFCPGFLHWCVSKVSSLCNSEPAQVHCPDAGSQNCPGNHAAEAETIGATVSPIPKKIQNRGKLFAGGRKGGDRERSGWKEGVCNGSKIR